MTAGAEVAGASRATRCRAMPRTPRRCSTRSTRRLQDQPGLHLLARPAGAAVRALGRARSPGSTRPSGELPDAAEWWYERRTLIRQLLGEGEPKLAYRAAAGYTDGPEGRLVEAHFHAGWIALCSSTMPRPAATHFAKMAQALDAARLGDAGQLLARPRPLDARRQATAPTSRLQRRGALPHGLLRPAGARRARAEAGAELRAMPDVAGQRGRVRGASRWCRPSACWPPTARRTWPVPLLRSFAPTLKTGGELRAGGAAGADDRRAPPRDHRSPTSPTSAACRSTSSASPRTACRPTPSSPAIDTAAIYAIARQESRFQVDAVSSSGARGLMQLMPGTAKETAEKIGARLFGSRLTSDPAYNALLGSTYLAAQLERYDGSLVLAAAAYNAGPGNANKWIDGLRRSALEQCRSGGLGRADPVPGDAQIRAARARQLPGLPRPARRRGYRASSMRCGAFRVSRRPLLKRAHGCPRHIPADHPPFAALPVTHGHRRRRATTAWRCTSAARLGSGRVPIDLRRRLPAQHGGLRGLPAAVPRQLQATTGRSCWSTSTAAAARPTGALRDRLLIAHRCARSSTPWRGARHRARDLCRPGLWRPGAHGARGATRPSLIAGTVLIDAGPVSDPRGLVRLRINLNDLDRRPRRSGLQADAAPHARGRLSRAARGDARRGGAAHPLRRQARARCSRCSIPR